VQQEYVIDLVVISIKDLEYTI